MNLNGNTLNGLASATASGQAIAFAQNNAQLTTNNAAIAVPSTSIAGSATPLMVTAPAGIVSGNALVLVASAGSSPTFTLPSGFTAIRTDVGSSRSQVVACKTATGSEPGSYSTAFTGGAGNGTGAVLQLWNTNCANLAASSGAFANSATSLTTAGLTTAQPNEYVLVLASWACSDVPAVGLGQLYAGNGGVGYEAVTGYLQAAAGAIPTPLIGPMNPNDCGASTIIGQQIAFIPTSTVQAAPLLTNQAGAQVQSLNASVNNVLNVMAPPSSALGDGNTDDLGAIQGAINNSFGYWLIRPGRH